MTQRSRQRGLGLFGFIGVVGLVGFFALVTIKTIPLYLNEMKIKRSVNAVAMDPDNADKDNAYITERLQRRWDVEDAYMLEPRDVKIVKEKNGGKALKYDYDARVNLFYNIYLVVQFTGDYKMRGPSNIGP
jgi:hypothetical protein